MQALNRILLMASGRQDLVFAIFLILIVGMLVLPLPVILVDTLLVFNITLTLLMLVAATYLKSVLELSTFPSILLITTVYRLALSVSTTRLILTEGNAGELIEAFGEFLVGGNVVVGLVIFFIIAIVNFIVITKGAERIAEVSARFTLDAMPGKQMSIDSDLRNGDIDKDEARRRRNNLSQESQFHGAMDGAMRFVKGDAIAGIIIIFVNLIGGLIIGMAQKDMSFAEAGQLYTILSVGDGLVAQIPAMFVSVAAGTIVTRVSNENSRHLGADISSQLGAEPKSLGIVAVAISILGMMPGFPTAVFLGIAAVLGFMSFTAWRRRMRTEMAEAMAAQREMMKQSGAPNIPLDGAAGEDGEAAPEEPESDENQIRPPRPAEPGDPFIFRAAMPTIIAMAQNGVGNALEDQARRLQIQLGFPIPQPSFRPDVKMRQGFWELDVEDVPTAKGYWQLGIFVQLNNQERLDQIEGVQYTAGPGLDGKKEVLWLETTFVPQIRDARVPFAYGTPEVAKILMNITKRYASRTFGINEATGWLQMLQEKHGRLAADVLNNINIILVVDVVRRLIEEEVPIMQARLILETILFWAPKEEDADTIADRTRIAMKRQICYAIADPEKAIRAVMVGPDIEEAFRSRGFSAPEDEILFQADPEAMAQAFRSVMEQIDRTQNTVFLTGFDTRRTLRKYLLKQRIALPVMAQEELDDDYRLVPLGMVTLKGAQLRLGSGDMPSEMQLSQNETIPA